MYSFEYPKGRVLISGYFFDQSTTLEVVKQKVFDTWGDKTKLYKTDLGFVLVLPNSQHCFVEELSCYPLIKQHGRLSNVLWRNDTYSYSEKNSILCFVQHGVNHEIELNTKNQFDPSVWIMLDKFSEDQMHTLGEIKKPEIKGTRTNKNVRSVLKDESLAESRELKDMLNNLSNIKQTGSVPKGKKIAGNSVFSRLKTFLSATRQGRVNKGKERRDRNESGRSSSENGSRPSPGSVGYSPGLFSKLRASVSNLLMASALGKVIGRAQVKYVQKLMEQLNKGNIDDALKTAIPLSNLQDAMKARDTALGSLSGRMSLNINPYSKGPSSSVSLGDEVLDRLRKMYENAFSRMDKAGNYKKAAFILAELLRDIDRAVAYLEKHKQFVLAAELAEGQNLSPVRVIRQWILADEVDRALHVAMISNCYEEAITALEGTHQKEANMLRWHLAQLHFQAGNIASAVDIAWPLNEKREKVIEWLKESYQLGGALGARHLVRLAFNDSENYIHYLKKINQLLSEQSSICSYPIIDEVIKSDECESSKRIATITSRAYLTTVGSGKIQHDSNRWNKLCKLAGDLTLRADTRNLQFNDIERKHPLIEASDSIEFHFDEAYGRKVSDIALLSNQTYLIAFGESGLEVWNSKGRKIKNLSTPCHRIVVSDSGTQALLITLRSGYQVISRLNVKNLDIQHWLDADLKCWADSYDGIKWMVAFEDSVVALDTNAKQQTVLWRVGDLKGEVHSLVRSSSSFSFCLSFSENFELWTYKLPNLYLKERTPYGIQNLKDILPTSYSASGSLVGVNEENENQFCLYRDGVSKKWADLGFESEISNIRLFDGFVAVESTLDDSSGVHLFTIHREQVKARVMSLHFSGSAGVILRLYGENLLICHADGRFVHVGTHFGELEAEFIV